MSHSGGRRQRDAAAQHAALAGRICRARYTANLGKAALAGEAMGEHEAIADALRRATAASSAAS